MSTAGSATATRAQRRLRPNGVGFWGMIYAVVAVTAPLTAIASNMTLSIALGPGAGTVGMIVLVTVVLWLFSVGYVRLSRQVVNAGAYFAYITYGLGRRAGSASAMVATLLYNAGAAIMAALVGFFGNIFLARYGVHVPWWLIAALTIAACWWIGYLGLKTSTRINGWVAITETALVVVLAIAVIVRNPGGWSMNVFAPSEVFSTNFGLAFVLCILSFTGFEAAAALGEEAKDAHHNVGRATYSALLLLAIVFVIGVWTLAAAFDDVVAVAQKDPGGTFVAAASTYLGSWIAPVLIAMITMSFFAATLSFHSLASRYMFSLGREGYLPELLSRTSARLGTPVAAGTVQVAVCAIILVPFAVAGSDPLLNLAPAIAGMNALAVVILMVACCASMVAAAFRGRLAGSAWAVRLAPTLSGTALLAGGYVIVSHYEAVTGSDSTAVAAMPLTLVVAVAYGWWIAGRRGALPGSSLDHNPDLPPHPGERQDRPESAEGIA